MTRPELDTSFLDRDYPDYLSKIQARLDAHKQYFNALMEWDIFDKEIPAIFKILKKLVKEREAARQKACRDKFVSLSCQLVDVACYLDDLSLDDERQYDYEKVMGIKADNLSKERLRDYLEESIVRL